MYFAQYGEEDIIRDFFGDKHSGTCVEIGAAFSKEGRMPFYLYGRDEHAQVSTLSENFKERVCAAYGDNYEQHPHFVDAVTLETVLEEAFFKMGSVDFLSVDCEGVDMEVLLSNDWEKYKPLLVCVEHSMPKPELDNFMKSVDYTVVCRTTGNSFFKK